MFLTSTHTAAPSPPSGWDDRAAQWGGGGRRSATSARPCACLPPPAASTSVAAAAGGSCGGRRGPYVAGGGGVGSRRSARRQRGCVHSLAPPPPPTPPARVLFCPCDRRPPPAFLFCLLTSFPCRSCGCHSGGAPPAAAWTELPARAWVGGTVTGTPSSNASPPPLLEVGGRHGCRRGLAPPSLPVDG